MSAEQMFTKDVSYAKIKRYVTQHVEWMEDKRMTLPCKDEHDCCSRKTPCRFRKDVDKGYRDAKWVAENKCETLQARHEGWKEVSKG
jgi:hypothetical protein